MFVFSLQATEAFLEHSCTFMVEPFFKKSYQLKVVNYFCKKPPPKTFRCILNKNLSNTAKNSHLQDIFPVNVKPFESLFLYAYLILSHKSEKRVIERNKRLSL